MCKGNNTCVLNCYSTKSKDTSDRRDFLLHGKIDVSVSIDSVAVESAEGDVVTRNGTGVVRPSSGTTVLGSVVVKPGNKSTEITLNNNNKAIRLTVMDP